MYKRLGLSIIYRTATEIHDLHPSKYTRTHPHKEEGLLLYLYSFSYGRKQLIPTVVYK